MLHYLKETSNCFDGDPLHYHAFMQSFEQTIELRTDDAVDLLHYLEQYTRGQPKQLVRSCQHMTDGIGMLQQRLYSRNTLEMSTS